MSKKNPYVFTISFNPNLPRQKEAAQLLNQMGRGKSFWVAEAIHFYSIAMEEKNLGFAPSEPQPVVEQTVSSVLKEDKVQPVNNQTAIMKKNEAVRSVLQEPVFEPDMDIQSSSISEPNIETAEQIVPSSVPKVENDSAQEHGSPDPAPDLLEGFDDTDFEAIRNALSGFD